MTLRSAAAVFGGLAFALAACSSAGIPAATTSPVSASVTQSAPSVWSAPHTDAAGAPTTTDAHGASGSSTLPGLTEACSAAIRAQLAVNDLFTEALQGSDGTTSAATSGARAGTSGITAERVATVFEDLAPSLPRKLAAALKTLRDAADSIVGKSATDVPAVLNGTAVTDAMDAFRHYIAACEPKPTD